MKQTITTTTTDLLMILESLGIRKNCEYIIISISDALIIGSTIVSLNILQSNCESDIG